KNGFRGTHGEMKRAPAIAGAPVRGAHGRGSEAPAEVGADPLAADVGVGDGEVGADAEVDDVAEVQPDAGADVDHVADPLGAGAGVLREGGRVVDGDGVAPAEEVVAVEHGGADQL